MADTTDAARSRWSRLVDWLWPHSCFVCGARAGAQVLCAVCDAELPRLAGPACPVCALPTPGGEVCGRCQRRPPHFDASLALYAYAHPVRDMVLALKHGQGFALARLFGAQLAGAAQATVDCVLPMPLHPRRLHTRGFNQSLLLARTVAATHGLALCHDAVLRDADTPQLAGLRRSARRRALRGAFRCTRRFDGRHVLVVDDVMTSGATLDELARTLKLAGAARVSNLVVARTLRQPRRD